MKRLLALILALTLCFSCAALAEPAATAEEAIDFGDFTMRLDPNTPGEITDRVDGETFFTFYPAYLTSGDEATNINGVWSGEYTDFSNVDSDDRAMELAEELMQYALDGYEQAGLKADNMQVLNAVPAEQDGVHGFAVVFQVDVDYSGIGYDLQLTLIQEQLYLSDRSFGTYIFTVSTIDLDTLANIANPILETITWNK